MKKWRSAVAITFGFLIIEVLYFLTLDQSAYVPDWFIISSMIVYAVVFFFILRLGLKNGS